MKYLVYDISNNGILAIAHTLGTANALRAGIIDSDVAYAFPGTPNYDKLSIGVPSSHYIWEGAGGQSTEMPRTAINDLYLEKRRLTSLRLPIINKLLVFTMGGVRRTNLYYDSRLDSDFSYCIDHSDPDAGIYHDSIVEYATINEISPAHAYKQLLLRSENFRSERIRCHAYFDYFVTRLNEVVDEATRDSLNTEVDKKVRKDLFRESFFSKEEK